MTAGPIAQLGGCYKVHDVVRFCADLEAIALVLGDGLPEGQIGARLQGVFSVGFDAL